MENEKQGVAQSNLHPSSPTGETYPPPYAAFQNQPPGGVAYPQVPPQQPAYHQPYSSGDQKYGDPGYPSATQQPYGQAGYPSGESGPPAYGYPPPGSVSYGQPQTVVLSGQPQNVVVAQSSSVSMIGAIVLSCFVFWCCGCLLGFAAFLLALVGQNTSSNGNSQSAIQLRNASYGVSVAGIILGIITIILLFVFRH